MNFNSLLLSFGKNLSHLLQIRKGEFIYKRGNRSEMNRHMGLGRSSALSKV